MPANIQVRVEPGSQLTIHTVTGTVTAEDIIAALKQFYTHQPTHRLLWDFREVDLSPLSKQHLMTILTVARSYAHSRPNGKTAIVTSGSLAYGISRMFENYTEIYGHPVDHEVFKSYDDALRWLCEGEEK
ncbi:MAG: hypothetical protein Kow0031_38060 [Anaerolineae bacterium]